MLRTFVYPAELERLDGEVIIRFPDFAEGLSGLTGAPTEREILAIAEDALEEIVLGRLARGEEVPRSAWPPARPAVRSGCCSIPSPLRARSSTRCAGPTS
jgi:hypothetical protein